MGVNRHGRYVSRFSLSKMRKGLEYLMQKEAELGTHIPRLFSFNPDRITNIHQMLNSTNIWMKYHCGVEGEALHAGGS